MTLARFALPVLLAGLLACAATLAQEPPRIEELSFLDRQFMTQQRQNLEDLARRHFGQGFSGEREQDLTLLQRLLDDGVVGSQDTAQLQAMGLVMGDLLADELDMHWVVYEDNLGRSRALRYRDSDNYLFPMTMVSRRREAGNTLPVTEIYQKAYDIIDPLREELPFR
ncbi:DUF3806 domain-containing protein [Parahaliea aestuarii]|uniref:DUF3806 domain-containing protein n=1 Tax=Parahaliea aestuarii TaxID=1852021 RepID=A0A5C8ZQE4_9GAMM|nr:DUF3806 domain-containing protein [Parahaliea aestuarii]TXS89717.1 DUF3806 domain-containing protein [Parahaliea aestuarii]